MIQEGGRNRSCRERGLNCRRKVFGKDGIISRAEVGRLTFCEVGMHTECLAHIPGTHSKCLVNNCRYYYKSLAP